MCWIFGRAAVETCEVLCSLQREVEEKEGRNTQSFAAHASLDKGWALEAGGMVMQQGSVYTGLTEIVNISLSLFVNPKTNNVCLAMLCKA